MNITILFIYSIIIVLLILLIYMIIINETNTNDKYIIFNKILYNNLKNDIKSGDLLLFSSCKYELISRVFGNPIFSHVGIIVKINNILYSLELVEGSYIYPGLDKKSGLILIPLEDRIKYYNGYIYIASLINPLNLNKENILIEFSKKKYKYTNRFKLILNCFNNYIFGKERFCSEFIAEILDKLEISSIPIKNKKIYLHTSIINLCNNILFKKPVQIIYEDRLIKNINNDYITNYLC